MGNSERVSFLALGVSSDGESPILLLGDKEKSLALPLVIGEAEAMTISSALIDEKPDVPSIHQLVDSILKKVDCQIERILISNDGTSCGAVIEIAKEHVGGEKTLVDAKPTDAIAIAIIARIPIHVSQTLFLEHAVSFTSENGGFTLNTEDKRKDDDQKFKEFLDSVKASDFNQLDLE